MNILIAGATGLIGRKLISALTEENHKVIVLTRNKNKAKNQLMEMKDRIHITDYQTGWDENIDTVINLAGSPVTRSWTKKQRSRIINSRLLSTDYIYIRCLQNKIMPKLWLTVSATGYYNDPTGREMDESYLCSSGGFLHRICEKIEKNSQKVTNIVSRHCILRIGLVLDGSHGFLSKLLPLYNHHLGGHIADGRQYLPWIHLTDVVAAMKFIIDHEECSGIINVSSPHPCTQAEFSDILVRLTGKRNPLHYPAFVVRLMLRNQSELFLSSQNVVPRKLLDHGFEFKYPEIQKALEDILICRNETDQKHGNPET